MDITGRLNRYLWHFAGGVRENEVQMYLYLSAVAHIFLTGGKVLLYICAAQVLSFDLLCTTRATSVICTIKKLCLSKPINYNKLPQFQVDGYSSDISTGS